MTTQSEWKLTATIIYDEICVRDNVDGLSLWYPDADALAEIEASEDPMATAVRICRHETRRGHWSN